MVWRLVAFIELGVFLSGLFLPLLKINEFWIFNHEITIANMLQSLFLNGEVILFSAVITFGVLLPFFKIVERILSLKVTARINLHKFAMLDIFLLAFLIFAGKLVSSFNATIEFGFYFLFASVLLGYIQIIAKKP